MDQKMLVCGCWTISGIISGTDNKTVDNIIRIKPQGGTAEVNLNNISIPVKQRKDSAGPILFGTAFAKASIFFL